MEFNLNFSRRHRLRRKEAREFLDKVSTSLQIIKLRTEKNIEIVKINSHQLFFISGVPTIIAFNDEVFPTLSNQDILTQLPAIVVDRGAVPHICNGADLMAPGIVRINDDFEVDRIIVVVDATHLKAISIVKSLYASHQILVKKRGKVAINLHYIGDKLWNVYKRI
jgi:PUA domain protein